MVHTSHSISAKIFFIFLVWQNFEPIRVEGEMARKKQIKDDRWHFCSSWNIFQKLWMKGVFFHTKRITHNRWSWAIEKQHVLHEILFTNGDHTAFWPKINNRWLRVIKKQLVLHEIFSNNGDQSMFFWQRKNIKQLMIAVNWKHVRLAWNILD